MLRLGIFGGKYMTDCQRRIPTSWFARAKLCAERHDAQLNFFGVNASQSLAVWRRNGWIHRRIHAGGFSGIAATTWAAVPADDARQIRRWRAIARHVAAIQRNCETGRSRMSPAPASGRAALGLRQPEDLTGRGGTMPFKSQAQRRKFAQLLVEGRISNQTFEEWNRETGSKRLPEHVKRKARARRKAR